MGRKRIGILLLFFLFLLTVHGISGAQGGELKISVPGTIAGYQSNPINVESPEAGILTIEIRDENTLYRRLINDIPGGKSQIIWDGLGWNEERLARKDFRLFATMTGESGLTYNAEVTASVGQPIQAILFALPSDGTVYLEEPAEWFLEFKMLYTDHLTLQFFRGEKMVLEVSRQAKGGRIERRTYSVAQVGRTATLKIPAAEVGAGVKTFEIVPEFATARKGDNGYFVLPNGLLGTFHEANGTCSTSEDWDNCLPFYGMKTPHDTFCMIAKGMRFRYSTRVEAKDGTYQMSHRYVLGGDVPYEDFELEYTFLPPDAEYPQMARVYRDWQLARGAVQPIRERMKKWPEVGAAATNLEMRIRQAWKPVPSPVPHQTRYNEPPVRAAVTFDRCGDIVREMKRQGVNHAEICLVGWNKGGHDGAYPQLFPVEPALGGEEKLRDFIKLSNASGFQTVCHTCFYSAYAIADDFDEEYLLKERDGSLQTRKLYWGGGQPFRICPKRAYERYALKNMQMMKDLGFHGLHYHDVYSILAPRICYDPRHPCSPKDSVKWYEKQMEVTPRRARDPGTATRAFWTSACTSTPSPLTRGISPRSLWPTGTFLFSSSSTTA